MKWLKSRLKEPTTFMGLALILRGVGEVARLDHVQPVADTIANAGEPLARGDWGTAGALILGGIFGVLMREKGEK